MTFLVMLTYIFENFVKIIFFSKMLLYINVINVYKCYDIKFFLELSMLSLKIILIMEIFASSEKAPLSTLLFNAFDHGPHKMLAIIFYLSLGGVSFFFILKVKIFLEHSLIKVIQR